MYSKMHWMFNKVSKSGKPGQRDQLAEWSKNFEPQCTELKLMKSGADRGKQWRVVHQNMKSLKEYQLLDDFNARGSSIPVYGSEEVALLFPNRKWRVYKIESTTEYEVIHADSTPPPTPNNNIVKKKKKKRRRVMFEEEDDDDDDCEEFEKHVKEKDYDYVRNWLRNEGLSMEDLCRGKTPQPPPEVIEILESSSDEELEDRLDDAEEKEDVMYVYKKDDYDEEDLYNEKGELLIGQKFDQTKYLLIADGFQRYEINQYSAQNIGNATIDEIVDYIYDEEIYTLFIKNYLWYGLPNYVKGKLLGTGVKLMVIKPYDDLNLKMPALPSDDDGDNSSSDEEIPPPPETEICPVITTMDMLTKDFVDTYAPWVSKGITRQQSVRRGTATVAFWFLGDQKSGQWAYADASSNSGWRSEFAEYRTPKINKEEENAWLRKEEIKILALRRSDGSTTTPSIFWQSPLNKDVNGPLKLYVQVKEGPSGKYYAIRGDREMFDMHDIKTILPKNYMVSRDRTKFTAAQKPTYNVRIKGYYYSDHLINVTDLIAFQLAVNKVNKKYMNVELTRKSPHLSPGFVPPENNQILGWHIKANFPDAIKKLIQDHDLQPLGACGPQREKGANETQWHYRFNINGMYDVQVNAMLSILCPVFPNIFCKQIPLYDSRGFANLREFIDSDAIVAVCAWGTAKARHSHERLMLKRKSMIAGWYLEIYDPWMQGTRKHNYGFKLIQKFLSRYNE